MNHPEHQPNDVLTMQIALGMKNASVYPPEMRACAYYRLSRRVKCGILWLGIFFNVQEENLRKKKLKKMMAVFKCI